MLGKAFAPDLFIESLDAEQKVVDAVSWQSNRILYIGLLISAIFHAAFLPALISNFLAQNKQTASVSYQEFDVQLEFLAEPNMEGTGRVAPETDVSESALDPETLETRNADTRITETQTIETRSIETREIARLPEKFPNKPIVEQPVDLSAEAISSAISKFVDATPADDSDAEIFDPRMRELLKDAPGSANPPPQTDELETYTSVFGETIVQISDSHCMKSSSESGIGDPVQLPQWSLPFKCGQDAGDRMMDRVNARLSEAGY